MNTLEAGIMVVSKLTAMYALLFTICKANWMPTSMQAYVKREVIVFLCNVIHGVKFNLGKLILQQIVATRDGKEGRKKLTQGFQQAKIELLEPFKETIKLDARLISGAHILDTEYPDSQTIEQDEPSISNPKKMMIDYIREELEWLDALERQIRTKRTKLT